jgi:hypothetical protein
MHLAVPWSKGLQTSTELLQLRESLRKNPNLAERDLPRQAHPLEISFNSGTPELVNPKKSKKRRKKKKKVLNRFYV